MGHSCKNGNETYLKCSDTGPSPFSRHLNNVPETNELKIFPRFSVSPTVSSTSALIRAHRPMVRGFVHGFSCVCSAGIQSCQASFSTTASEFSIAAAVRLKGSSFLSIFTLSLPRRPRPCPSLIQRNRLHISSNVFFGTFAFPLHSLLWKIKISVLGS
jgi:hypothetical protein